MFYNARWYDPALGRFAQADTIIPDGVQGLDRYAYVNNNPLRYTDPSGHYSCDHISNSYAQAGCQASTPQAETYAEASRQAEVRRQQFNIRKERAIEAFANQFYSVETFDEQFLPVSAENTPGTTMAFQEELLEPLEFVQAVESFGVSQAAWSVAPAAPMAVEIGISAVEEFGPDIVSSESAPTMSDLKDLIVKEHIIPAAMERTGIYVSYVYYKQNTPYGMYYSGRLSVRSPNGISSYNVSNAISAQMIWMWFSSNYGR